MRLYVNSLVWFAAGVGLGVIAYIAYLKWTQPFMFLPPPFYMPPNVG